MCSPTPPKPWRRPGRWRCGQAGRASLAGWACVASMLLSELGCAGSSVPADNTGRGPVWGGPPGKRSTIWSTPWRPAGDRPGVPGDAPVELTLRQAYLGVVRAYQGHAHALRLTGQAADSARLCGLSAQPGLRPAPRRLGRHRCTSEPHRGRQRRSFASTGLCRGGLAGVFQGWAEGGDRRRGRIPALRRRRAMGTAGLRPSCSGRWRGPRRPAILPRPATRCAWPHSRRTGWAST